MAGPIVCQHREPAKIGCTRTATDESYDLANTLQSAFEKPDFDCRRTTILPRIIDARMEWRRRLVGYGIGCIWFRVFCELIEHLSVYQTQTNEGDDHESSWR